MKKLAFFLIFYIPFWVNDAGAFPFVAREASTLGALTFETGMSVSNRFDAFGDPRTDYRTVNFPFYARLGILRDLDLGFSLHYLSHSIEQNNVKLKGSATSVFSPELKWSFFPHWALLGIFTLNRSENDDDSLPVGRGDSYELTACFSPQLSWPLHLNVGYVWQESFKSKFGIRNGAQKILDPGDIFQAQAALEIPLTPHFSMTTETAYYYTTGQKVSNSSLMGSRGPAWDAFAGVKWRWRNWTLGAKGGVGLLSERLSSFDLQRGAGNGMFQVFTSYRLPPWWVKQ